MAYGETTDQYLRPGTKVRNDGLIEGGPEYGVVVYCWLNEETNFFDCHVAFYGNSFPDGEPSNPRYVLRYASTSLVVIP